MKTKMITGLVLVAVALMSFTLLAAEPNKGAEQIVLDGGKKGPVPFPHHRHQAAVADCNVCHSVFPQEPGSIQRLKAAGTIKAQSDVMNKLCKRCHQAKRNAGEKAGPVTCNTCHQK